MLEKDIQKKILAWLNAQPRCHAVKISANPFQRSGISDILACTEGRFMAIEVKRPGEEPTALQTTFIERIKASGGIAFTATSLEQVKVMFECSLRP